MKRPGPELEYWVEVWDRGLAENAFGWRFHSIHQTRDAAKECAAERFRSKGGRWRVLDVAKWPVAVFE